MSSLQRGALFRLPGPGVGPSHQSRTHRPWADTAGKGALLRRERLLTSHISEWRRARKGGALKALEPRTRKPGRSPAEIENEKLRQEKDKLAKELAQTKAALEIVGKAHALLEMLSESADSDEKPKK